MSATIEERVAPFGPRQGGWDFTVQGYYGGGHTLTGHLAFETVHRGQASKQMEVTAAAGRPDIGRIIVTHHTWGPCA